MVDTELKPAQGVARVADTGAAVLMTGRRAPVQHGDAEGLPRSAGADIELTILMPCLDEAVTLPTCVRKAFGFLARAGIEGEVLVADNGSTDGSPELARRLGARVVHVAQRGYGNGLIAGIRAARGR